MDDLENGQVEAQINEETTVNETVVEEQKEDKRPSSVVKLLKQRNEVKRENEELKAKLSEQDKTAKRLSELEEMVAKQALDSELKAEKTDFFSKNPSAKEFESEIDKLVDSK
jgi:hypothetical protein